MSTQNYPHSAGREQPMPRTRLAALKAAPLALAAGLILAASPLSAQMAFAAKEAAPTEQKEKVAQTRGWLGVAIQNVDDDTAAALGLPDTAGALVKEIAPDSPAAGAGLQVHDVILALDGTKIMGGDHLASTVAGQAPGTTIEIKVWREAREQSVKVKLGEPPKAEDDGSTSEQGAAGGTEGRLGISLTRQTAGEGEKEAVKIAEVDPSSDAARKGLMPGDIILRVGQEAISTPEQAVEVIKAAKNKGLKAVLLLVKSGEDTRSISVRFGA
jgi:serine protease Do